MQVCTHSCLIIQRDRCVFVGKIDVCAILCVIVDGRFSLVILGTTYVGILIFPHRLVVCHRAPGWRYMCLYCGSLPFEWTLVLWCVNAHKVSDVFIDMVL